MQQFLECIHWAQVGEQSQFLAHCQQSLLGAHLSLGVVVILGVAYGAEQHCVGLAAGTVCLVGVGVTRRVNGCCTHKGVGVCYVVTELGRNSVNGLYRLCYNLGAYAVAREHCNVYLLHISIVYSRMTQSPGVCSQGNLRHRIRS